MEISETLATRMAELILPYAQQEVLMPKTAQEIFTNQELWFPKFNQADEIIGFFEYRTHDRTDLAEMGSVLSLESGVGQCLLQVFNTQKDIRGASGGFAVTKDSKTAHDFFSHLTEGDIQSEENFPAWFKEVRESSDRYFIQWK